MIFEFKLQIGEDSKKEISLEKLVLVFNARPFYKLSDSAQTLCYPVVILNIHKMVLVFLILVLQNLPDTTSHIEVGCSGQSSQKDLIGPEVTFTKIDEKLEQNKLWWLFTTDCIVVGVNAVGKSTAFVESSLLEVYFIEDLLNLHEKVNGIRFIGEVAVENSLDVAITIVTKQGIEVLQTDEEELAVRDAHRAGLEVVEDRENEFTLAHKVAHFVSLFAFLTVDEDSQHLHQP